MDTDGLVITTKPHFCKNRHSKGEGNIAGSNTLWFRYITIEDFKLDVSATAANL